VSGPVLLPGEAASDNHCIGGWVNPMEAKEKMKILPLPGIEISDVY
jgi:hypothetical protein